tara:strand:- start:37 stop:564 length:528 start_codon:yes stop_codon:yes gene_type:complete
MKISKQRLKEIIKEELSGLGESDKGDYEWDNNPANTSRPADADSAAGYPNDLAALADVAARLGASPDASAEFATAASAAIVVATSTPDSTGGDNAMKDMLTALVNLALSKEDPALEEGPSSPSNTDPRTVRANRRAKKHADAKAIAADPRKKGAETAYKKHMAKAAEEREAKDKK